MNAKVLGLFTLILLAPYVSASSESCVKEGDSIISTLNSPSCCEGLKKAPIRKFLDEDSPLGVKGVCVKSKLSCIKEGETLYGQTFHDRTYNICCEGLVIDTKPFLNRVGGGMGKCVDPSSGRNVANVSRSVRKAEAGPSTSEKGPKIKIRVR